MQFTENTRCNEQGSGKRLLTKSAKRKGGQHSTQEISCSKLRLHWLPSLANVLP